MDKKVTMNFHPPTSEDLASPLYITWAGKKQWGAGEYVGFKTVNIHVLVYVMSGKGSVIQGKREESRLEKGSVFVIFPGVRFRFTADSEEPWEFYWASLGGSACETLLSSHGLSVENFAVDSLPDSAGDAISIVVNRLSEETPDRLAVIGGMLLLFSEISRLQGTCFQKGEARKDIVPMAVQFIETYYFMHLDVDMLCDYVKYSRSYLSRLFNNELGVTIPEYINQVRVRHAKKLFEQTTLSVQEVSSSVGIIDSFYFSKTFKKLVGISPNQYKKQYGVHARYLGRNVPL